MSVIPHEIEAYQVQHLPIVKAYADKIGLVEVINQLVPTEMMVDPGTLVLGLVLDTLGDFLKRHYHKVPVQIILWLF